MNLPSETLHRIQHSFVSAFVVFWITLNEAYAQSNGSTFGLYRSWSTPGEFEKFLISAADGRTHIVMLWNHSSNRIAQLGIDSALTVTRSSIHSLSYPVTELILEDLDGDGKQEIIALHAKEQQITIYKNAPTDTLKPMSTIMLSFQPSALIIAEISGDRKPDVLVFSTEVPGVVPFLNKGGGRFTQAATMAQDNLVADLRAVQLNNDRITDLIMLDWVRSELHLLFGIGQGKFLDMSTITIEEGVTNCYGEQLSSQGYLDIVLLSKKNQTISILEGNGRGEYALKKKIALPSQVLQLEMSDLSQDGTKDFMMLSRKSELQLWNDWQEDPTPEYMSYAAGSAVKHFILEDMNYDGRKDVVLLDSARSSLAWYSGARSSRPLTDTLEFVAGVQPGAITISDVNSDGRNDVALLNAESGSLSLYLQNSTNGFSNQITYMIGGNPKQLVSLSSVDSLAQFLVAVPQKKAIASLSVSTTEHSLTRTDIPTPGQAKILSWERQRNSMLGFYCFNPIASTSSGILSYYQQIDASNYMERSFSLAAPGSLLGACMADLNNDGKMDVAYIHRNNVVKRYELAISLGDSSLSYKQKTFFIDLPDRTFLKAMLWSSDFNGDHKPDLLFTQAGQNQSIRLAVGRGDGTFNQPDTVATLVTIDDRTQLQIVDFDRDGFLDILVNDSRKNILGWYRGITGRLFDIFRPLVSGEKIGHFALGQLNGDEFLDIAVTFLEKGTVKLYDGRMLVSRRNSSE
ncbi:MAG: VCBS repeat-containing protein [bacterium]